jgi:hypothetical protein
MRTIERMVPDAAEEGRGRHTRSGSSRSRRLSTTTLRGIQLDTKEEEEGEENERDEQPRNAPLITAQAPALPPQEMTAWARVVMGSWRVKNMMGGMTSR